MLKIAELTEIADFADQDGQYEVASDITSFVKNAQLWEALRGMFDPAYGVDAPFWKRMQRAWRSGRINRDVGLVLAINAEITKINKKIEELATPLKEFYSQVGTFYDKLRSRTSGLTAGDLREELGELKGSLKSTLKLIGSSELKKLLNQRSKLVDHQVRAAEKIKGLDPDSKANLIAVLRGEAPMGAGAQQQMQQQAPAVPGSEERGWKPSQGFQSWLNRLNIPTQTAWEGFESSKGQGGGFVFMRDIGFNPKAMMEYFKANPNVYVEGVRTFGPEMKKLTDYAMRVFKYEADGLKQEGKEAPATPIRPGELPSMEPIKSDIPATPAEKVDPVLEQSLKLRELEKQRKSKVPSEKDEDDARRQEREERRRQVEEMAEEEKRKIEQAAAAAGYPRAAQRTSQAATTRLERQIKQFSRMKEIEKLKK